MSNPLLLDREYGCSLLLGKYDFVISLVIVRSSS